MYLLDTNIISMIPFQNEQSQNISDKLAEIFQKHGEKNKLYISIITYQEIIFGIMNGRRKHGLEFKKIYFDKILNLLRDFSIINYNKNIAEQYIGIQSNCLNHGIIVHIEDGIIAATAKEFGLILVTNNTKDFCNIEGLKLEDWSKP